MEKKYLPYLFAFLFGISSAAANPDKTTILGVDKTKHSVPAQTVQTAPVSNQIAGMQVEKSTPTAKTLEQEVATFSYLGKTMPSEINDTIDALYDIASQKSGKNFDKEKFGNWIKVTYGSQDVTPTLMCNDKGLYLKGTTQSFSLATAPETAKPADEVPAAQKIEKSNAQEVKKSTEAYVSSRAPQISIGALYSDAKHTARTNVYNYESKGNGAGVTLSASGIPLGKNYFFSGSLEALVEDTKTRNIIRDTEVGKMHNSMKNAELSVNKDFKNGSAKIGATTYNNESSEDYYGITAESSVKLAGLNYGFDYNFSGTPLTVSYCGECLSDCADSDVKKITMNEAGVKLGPVSMGMKTRAIDGEGPVVQQLAQSGIFPSELNVKWSGKNYSISASQYSNYNTCASATGYGFDVNLSKNLSISYNHTKLDRDSKDKKTGSERSLVGLKYTLK